MYVSLLKKQIFLKKHIHFSLHDALMYQTIQRDHEVNIFPSFAPNLFFLAHLHLDKLKKKETEINKLLKKFNNKYDIFK